jgi:probable S-adenosylmethionine-dependent methyltransferase, YraL family
MSKGVLYIVATPIGNLGDITLRAIDILKKVDVVAAEDTRHTLKLLNHLQISKPLISYYRHNEGIKSEIIINKLLNGENIALVSDAGTPAISDPGEELVKAAIENNIILISLPGPTAAISGLIVSGISTKEFVFIGFLPTSAKLKKHKLEELETENKTLIFYEAPHKVINTLEYIKKVFGDRNIAVCRELTKIHEEIIRGKISDIILKLENPKGEFVLVVEGNMNIKEKSNILNDMTIEEHYKYYEKQGFPKKEIIKLIAKDKNVNKNEIYKKFI